MKVQIGKKPDQVQIHRVALVHRKGHTYVFGADPDRKELRDLRLHIPFNIAFDRTSEKFTINEHVSQGIPVGDAIVAWVAWYADAPATIFFVYEEYAVNDDRVHFAYPMTTHQLVDISTPDDRIICDHDADAKIAAVLSNVWPDDFITVDSDEGVKGDVGQCCGASDVQPENTNPHSPLAELVKVLRRDVDHEPTLPEELEVEADERPGYIVDLSLDQQMQDAIMDMSMVTERERRDTEQFSLTAIYTERNTEFAITGHVKEAYGDQFADVMVLRMLAKRYLAMLRVDSSSHIDYSVDRFGKHTSVTHLRWMLGELDRNCEQSLTKKHRWLGYIQGLLVAYGYTTVDRERDYTREIFRGK